MQFLGIPISAFSLFLPAGQIEWHKSFKAPRDSCYPSFSHPQNKPLSGSKRTSASYYILIQTGLTVIFETPYGCPFKVTLIGKWSKFD